LVRFQLFLLRLLALDRAKYWRVHSGCPDFPIKVVSSNRLFLPSSALSMPRAALLQFPARYSPLRRTECLRFSLWHLLIQNSPKEGRFPVHGPPCGTAPHLNFPLRRLYTQYDRLCLVLFLNARLIRRTNLFLARESVASRLLGPPKFWKVMSESRPRGPNPLLRAEVAFCAWSEICPQGRQREHLILGNPRLEVPEGRTPGGLGVLPILVDRSRVCVR